MLIPAIFKLPIFKPDFAHLFNLVFLSFFSLADPFVLFLFLLFLYYISPWALFGTLFWLLYVFYIMIHILVALAHGGANPMPTPAGLKLGGLLMVVVVAMVSGGWWRWLGCFAAS
jgi:hypothetical protein